MAAATPVAEVMQVTATTDVMNSASSRRARPPTKHSLWPMMHVQPQGSAPTQMMTETSTSRSRKLLGRGGDSVKKDASLRELLYFEGCEELLRGCHLRTIMRRCAQIFKNSSGSASTYALSERTSRLQAFVSHNWAVGRWRKFTCLAFHYNFQIGVAFAVVAMLCGPLLHYFKVLPTYLFNGVERGFASRLLAAPAFLLGLYFGRDLLPGLPGPVVFLDKVCIHQTDKDLQRRAILKLGAFLKASDTMLICYTDLYLTKLWTVYEVASYLSLFGAGRMRFTHCSVSAGTTVIIITWYVVDSAALLLHVFVYDHAWAEFVLLPAALVCIAACLRKILRGRARMESRMANFSIHEGTVFEEDDRQLIYSSIHALMQAVHGRELALHEALELFNQIVREELPQTMAGVFGRFGVPLHIMMSPPAVILLGRISDTAAWLWSGGTFRQWIAKVVLYYIFVVGIFTPVGFMTMPYVAGCKLQARGPLEVCIVLLTASLCFCALFMIWTALVGVQELALGSDLYLAAYSAFVIGGSALSMYLYVNGFGHCRPSRRPKAQGTLRTLEAADDAAGDGGDESLREPPLDHLELAAKDEPLTPDIIFGASLQSRRV